MAELWWYLTIADVSPLSFLEWYALGVYYWLSMSSSPLSFLRPLGVCHWLLMPNRCLFVKRQDSGGVSLFADIGPLSVLEWQHSGGKRLIAGVGQLLVL